VAGVNRNPAEAGYICRIMYYVCIIQSVQTKKFYTGSTPNVQKRLKKHNTGFTKSTKSYRPYKLVYWEEFATKSEAIRKEKQIKRYKGGDAFKKLIVVS
jgi:putative endonuclease